MRAFAVSMYVAVSDVVGKPLPVILVQIIIALPNPPGKNLISHYAELIVDERLSPKVIEANIQEFPYELYLAGQ